MALSDPQTVTIGAGAVTLPRVASGDYRAVYQKDDGFVTLKVQHLPSKNSTRRSVRLETIDVAADPLMAGVNREVPFAITISVQSPSVGLSIAQQKEKAMALLNALTASSGALLTKVLGGES
jgi:hypothetical protein